LGNGNYTGHVNIGSSGTTVATASVTFAASGNSGTLTAHCPSTPNVNWSFTTGATLSPGACTLQSSSGATTYNWTGVTDTTWTVKKKRVAPPKK